jgi:proteasome inhibitor subunit 1 (PI31)
MIALGFRLIGVDDSSSASNITDGVLPSEWNRNGPGSYTFRYRHEQSNLEYIVKVAKLGSRTLVNAIAVEVCILAIRLLCILTRPVE